MNSLTLLLISLVIFIISYKFYAGIIEKLFDVKKENKTPAYTKFDGIDYIPAKNWLILFGHHFSSIAGAGPIIGPVIACGIWGWLPSFLWIVLGCIFLGAVHDFCSLICSLRHEGRSIADVSEKIISKRTKIIFEVFIWLALILVIAVFASAAAETFVTTNESVIPAFGLIFLAIIFGIIVYRLNANFILATIFGLVCSYGLIILGYKIPIKWNFNYWLYILLAYAFVASVLPVNVLLQPRDYLSSYFLFFGTAVGIIGIILTRIPMHVPIFIKANQPVFPLVFVFIACGAISGFHSLIASGTTAKQLSNEIYGKRITYGGMLTEGVVAIIAIISVCAGLYWFDGKEGFIYPQLMKQKGWLTTFSIGYGEITKPILRNIGAIFGVIMLNAFIITTLDTATRIARYLGDELFGDALKIKFMKNIYINTIIVIGFALYLSLGTWKAIWPVFGASNQLVAALALIVITAYLLSIKKRIRYTFYPAIFMLSITISALVYNARIFFAQNKYLLFSISIILIILAIFMLVEVISQRLVKKKNG